MCAVSPLNHVGMGHLLVKMDRVKRERENTSGSKEKESGKGD